MINMKKNILAVLLVVSLLSFLIDKKALFLLAGYRNQFLTSLMLLFSNELLLIALFLIVPSLFLWKNKKDKIMLLFSTFISAYVIVQAIKFLIGRLRPYELFQISPILTETTYSMPSGHATIIFAGIPFIFKNFKKTRSVFLIFAVIVSFSRLYLGVHYLSDVLVGITLGILIGELLFMFEEKQKFFKKVEKRFERWL